MKTEFEFTLPRGYVDSEGNLHKKGWMRLARAKDTLAPLQDQRVQKNNNYLLVILLARVVTKLGSLKLINPPVIEGLFSSDLLYLMQLYKEKNEDPLKKIPVKCDQCGHLFESGLPELGEL